MFEKDLYCSSDVVLGFVMSRALNLGNENENTLNCVCTACKTGGVQTGP